MLKAESPLLLSSRGTLSMSARALSPSHTSKRPFSCITSFSPSRLRLTLLLFCTGVDTFTDCCLFLRTEGEVCALGECCEADVGGVSMADSQFKTEGGDCEVTLEVIAIEDCHCHGCEVED